MSRWRWAALVGAVVSIALIAVTAGGALILLVPLWLVALAIRYDNHTGSLLFLAVGVLIVVLVMLGLVALLAMRA